MNSIEKFNKIAIFFYKRKADLTLFYELSFRTQQQQNTVHRKENHNLLQLDCFVSAHRCGRVYKREVSKYQIVCERVCEQQIESNWIVRKIRKTIWRLCVVNGDRAFVYAQTYIVLFISVSTIKAKSKLQRMFSRMHVKMCVCVWMCIPMLRAKNGRTTQREWQREVFK